MDAETSRFWLNDPPGGDAPEWAVVALVDEDGGGEVAYFIDWPSAYAVLRLLRELEAGPAYPRTGTTP